MTARDLFNVLVNAKSVAEVSAAVDAFEAAHPGETAWEPVGRFNNRGTIEASADPGRAAIERVTNGIDGVLELEHDAHGGKPDCRSPKEAALAWLGVPESGLAGMSTVARQKLARRVAVQLEDGDGPSSRILTVRDLGVGIEPQRQPDTILSLGASNKITKHYLAGAYGQGGSATFVVSKFSVIASRYDSQASVGFTVVKYLDLPAETHKTGHYVYLTLNGSVAAVEVPLEEFAGGTVVRHYGYDLTRYAGPFGTNSVYGLLQRTMFDPVMPVWLDSRVHGYRRTIKGSRNALNGAVDEGDDDARGPELSHNVPLYYVTLGDYGRIGLEYWVLEPGKKTKVPIAAFVEPSRPIVMTLNGQTHAEMTSLLVRKKAELPYLRARLIVHIDCNGLTPEARRTLFVSNREEARRGALYDLVEAEVVRALKADDELARLNAEARDKGLREEDEDAAKQMRSEVAKLLRLQGVPVVEAATATAGGASDQEGEPKPHKPRPPRPVVPLETHDPPTYIRLLWDPEEPITFFKTQRRYIRLETDANSTYHDPAKPEASRINLIVAADGVTVAGSTPLKGGRMRVILEAAGEPPIGAEGTVRIELSRPGLATLSDERSVRIVAPPKAEPKSNQLTLPPFKVLPVDGPDDERWASLGWPEDVSTVAATTQTDNETLIVWYSTVFPPYAKQRARLEQQDTALATSFDERYKTWLAVHALLKVQDEKAAETASTRRGEDDDAAEERDRLEATRAATMATLFAVREVHEAKERGAAEGSE